MSPRIQLRGALQAATFNTNARYSLPKITATMSTNTPTFDSIGVKNTSINFAVGINLSQHQKLLVGSVLDLFEGNPTLKHLSLWNRNGVFADPITDAVGYDRFAAQWYGLPAVFGNIQLISHKVVDGGNPMEVELQNRYTAKVIGKTQEIKSRVKIWVSGDGQIERVEDRWDGKELPEGFVGEALRKLNAVTVPMMVKVPKTEEEDMKMYEEREKA
ncbi:hypothetical protein B0T14DRAFT_505417 [Immersiella caudata]|uniref:Uncharacterized protein n=1 Tax=Immersiella caudata TaxID=314043 RepID=A0AA40CD04_9PEZI|nr:hypothetical protein B0T14DRAFT_505417 [Immersiella caudata]